jgi:hypothetical protein
MTAAYKRQEVGVLDAAALRPPLHLLPSLAQRRGTPKITETRIVLIFCKIQGSISKEQYRNYKCPYFFVKFNFSTK